ncbi:transglycosylase SLT domain-containing protein [Kribbella hippodromi]|uniref:Transglycosylase SLT domain-containing protein n=1 Tax=Kribbella hippodromi TaxID=434347 RepID=A0ABN2DV62_9ACTN
MKAKRSVAALSVTGIAVVSVVAGIDLFSSPGSSNASENVSGRAELAVINSGKVLTSTTPAATPKSGDLAAAADAVRMRNQVEAIEQQRIALQNAADQKMDAKNAAMKRYQALQEADRSVREERASRDAERKKYEGTPKEVAMNLLPDHGWGQSQFSCLEKLWNKESRWKVSAANPTSSAYGIPQALPGKRMAAYGSDWRTNPVTQIKWGLDYIEATYGSPCSAWSHSVAKNWY